MKVLRRLFGAAALLLLAFVAVGVLLPRAWTVERSVVVALPPDSVHAVLARAESWRRWMPWPDSLRTLDGPAAGAGSGFRWNDSRYGRGTFTIVAADEPGRIAYEVSVEEGALRVEGRIRLSAADGGTRIRWTESGAFGRNPLLGYTALTVEEDQGRQLEGVLERLRRDLEGGSGGRG